MEGCKSYGQNIIKSKLVHDKKHTIIIGVYIPPSEVYMTNVKFLDHVMMHENVDSTIILGDLNINSMNPKDEQSIDIADTIATYNIRNLAQIFKCKHNKPVRWT